jgi:hypothetical protein
MSVNGFPPGRVVFQPAARPPAISNLKKIRLLLFADIKDMGAAVGKFAPDDSFR